MASVLNCDELLAVTIAGVCWERAFWLTLSGERAVLDIRYDDGQLTAHLAGARLKDVAELTALTGAKVVLVGNEAAAEQPISAPVNRLLLEKAASKIFRGYSYTLPPRAKFHMPRLTLLLPDLKTGSRTRTTRAAAEAKQAYVFAEAGDSAVAAGKETDEGEETEPHMAEAETLPAAAAIDDAAVPRDLDECMPLPEASFGAAEADRYQDPTAADSSADVAAWEERRREAHLQRALSATGSKHRHLREMGRQQIEGKDNRILYWKRIILSIPFEYTDG